MIVLDSSAVIELIAGEEKGKRIKDILENDTAAVSSITINEVCCGAWEKQVEILYEFFKSVHVLPFDSDAAFTSIMLEKELYKKGRPLGKLDIFIASLCLLHQLPLLTLDKGFSRVDGLRVVFV